MTEWARRRAVWAVLVVGMALVVAQIALRVTDTSASVAETAGALALTGWLATRRPVITLALLGGLAMFGWNPVVVHAGSLDIRALDLPFVILSAQVLFDRARPPASIDAAKYIVALLAVTGVATFYVSATASSEFERSLGSWARLVITALLIWLTSAALHDRREFTFFLRALIVAAMGAVAYGAVDQVLLGAGGRADAFGGPNAYGLIAGVLVLAGLHASVLPNRLTRFAAAGIGLVGLGLCESIASITGTAIAVILGGVGTWSAHRATSTHSSEAALRTWGRLVAAAVLAFAVVSALRPVDLPGSKGFEHSSAAIRLSVGYAGLEIFRAHPLVGVGWQQSSTDGVINAPSVVEAVEERFGDLRTYSEAGSGITSVHNMYVQFLAETGLLGCAVLLWVLFGMTRIVRRALRAFAHDAWWASNARFLSLVLLLLVVWWNDNPLFGAQPESFLAAITIGLLAAAVRIGGSAPEPAAVEEPAEPVASAPRRRIAPDHSEVTHLRGPSN